MLAPFSALYAAIARRRLEIAERYRIDAPVLCVGNLTVGGSGKTPVAIALAGQAEAGDLKAGFLSRGHGGAVSEPHLVDPDRDSARHVGDEPLLLARAAMTVVAPDRVAGAKLLLRHGCDFIIMDDGFQSAKLHMDYALLVVDARRGIGNGRVVPAGPLRARLVDQMSHADGVLKVGEGEAAEIVVRHAARSGRPVYAAAIVPRQMPALYGKKCLAFAGIGDPEKFFDTLRKMGTETVMTRPFADHHYYSEFDASELLSDAQTNGLQLVTTAKDAARLAHGQGTAVSRLYAAITVIEIDISFENEHTPGTIIDQAMEAWRRRRLDFPPSQA